MAGCVWQGEGTQPAVFTVPNVGSSGSSGQEAPGIGAGAVSQVGGAQ